VIVRYSPPPVDPSPDTSFDSSFSRDVGGISFELTNLADLVDIGASISVSATVGTVTRDGATVTVTGLADGQSTTVTVTASKAGFSDSRLFVTNSAKDAQSALSMSSSSTIGYLGSLALTTSGGDGTGAVTFTASGTGCSVSGSTLSVDETANVGDSCTVSATKDADDNYKVASSADQTVTVEEADQAALKVTNSGDVPFNGSVELAFSGGSGDGSVSWSESCANFGVDGTTLTAKNPDVNTSASVGTQCDVTVTKAASTNYNEATATKQFTVVKATPVFDAYSPVSAQVGSADQVLVVS
jgi:hypothetical protein